MPSSATHAVHKRNTVIYMRHIVLLLIGVVCLSQRHVICGGFSGTIIRDAGIVCVGITGVLKRVCWSFLCWLH